MNLVQDHLNFIWVLMLGGVISGAAIGLFFHNSTWLGGYGSYRRRLLRLGHISFFGLAFVNGVFVLTLNSLPLSQFGAITASLLLIAGSVLMPLSCFLTAYRERFRFLFPLPTLAIASAIVAVLSGGV